MKLQATLPSGAGIVLRPPEEADIPTIYEGALASRAELAPWMPWCGDDFNIEAAEKWVTKTNASDAERAFTVWDETEQHFLGNCGLHDLDAESQSAALGYWIRTDQNGHGIASTAARAVVDFAFGELKLMRVEIVIAAANKASQRVAEKIGAIHEGVMRNGMMHHGETRDAMLYSLIPSDLAND